LFRGFIQTADYPGAVLSRWQQILTALSRCIQASYRLIEIDACPADQPRCRHQIGERLTQRRSLPGLSTAGRG
jgi:hypothetical protein